MITKKQTKENEIDMMLDGIFDGNIELENMGNGIILGDDLKEIIPMIPMNDRAYYLNDAINREDIHFVGGYVDMEPRSIFIRYPEMGVKLPDDASPQECLEDPDDWHIDGDWAYLYVGEGAMFPVNISRTIFEYLDDLQNDAMDEESHTVIWMKKEERGIHDAAIMVCCVPNDKADDALKMVNMVFDGTNHPYKDFQKQKRNFQINDASELATFPDEFLGDGVTI